MSDARGAIMQLQSGATCALCIVLSASAAAAQEVDTTPPAPSSALSSAVPTVDQPTTMAAPSTPPTTPVAVAPRVGSPSPTPRSRHKLPDYDTVPEQDWRIIGTLGAFYPADGGPGFIYGASFQYRSGPFVGGALLAGSVFFDDYTSSSTALLVGLVLRPWRFFRGSCLAEVGSHGYSGGGGSGGDPAWKGSTPFAGGRAALTFTPGPDKSRGHLEVGLYADLQDDLTRQRIRTYSEGTLSHHAMGTWGYGLGIEIGGSRDIF